MLFLLKTLAGLANLLNSEKSPWQLGAGVAFGMLVGLSPLTSLHNLILFFIVCLFRVNLSMFFVSFGLFKLFAFLLDPFFDCFGYWVLVDLTSLRSFWVQVTSGPIWPYFRWNNTIVIGALVSGLILWIPTFLGAVWAVKTYRSRWREKWKDSRWVKALKATPLYGLYVKVEGVREKMSMLS